MTVLANAVFNEYRKKIFQYYEEKRYADALAVARELPRDFLNLMRRRPSDRMHARPSGGIRRTHSDPSERNETGSLVARTPVVPGVLKAGLFSNEISADRIVLNLNHFSIR